ncbi:MAG: cell division protein ZapD [Gammaproteobacteria bacterium]
MSNKITYEQPLNERIRNLLRLEHLFNLVDSNIQDLTDWHSRFILEAMLEIMDLLSRSDLKGDLIKELEKHANMLNGLKDNPAVDPVRLSSITARINDLLKILKAGNYQPGMQLKSDELVNSFKQRISIPGGTCSFDLPRFHHWLNLPDSIIKDNLLNWFSDLEPVKQAVSLTLDMIRNSSQPSMETARDGFYQKPMDSKITCQLIRVKLPLTSSLYPEISGGKHRFTIRFMENPSTSARAAQTSDDVEFELHCCML